MQTNLIVSVTILSRKKVAPTYSTNIPRSTIFHDLVKARKFSSLREPSEALYPFKER